MFETTPSAITADESTSTSKHSAALVVLTSLFFMWGLITSLNDILIPHLKAAFDLSYVQAMLIQFCFFGAYAVMSYPAGRLVEAVGYKRGIIVGLACAGSGCLLFYPAADAHAYALFLGALFVLASGITLLQVAANPYVAILGTQQTASARLNLTQAFNSLGTTVGPYVGSMLILASLTTGVAGDASAVQMPYVGLAAALFVIAIVISQSRLPQVKEPEHSSDIPAGHPAYRQHASAWGYRHLVFGALAIFVYVGAEVSIGSFLVNFMSQPDVAGFSHETAGKHLAFYWGGAMVGRFVGVAVLRRVKAGHLLAFNALAAATLIVLSMLTSGHIAMWALLAVGLFNSIMFPTIFTLAIEGLGRHTGQGSGILCMAIVGGALVPVLQATLADQLTLPVSFIVPAVCYLYIAWYGSKGHYADFK